MDISSLNWLAVIVAGLSAFLLGGIWYSPILFSRAWMKENHLTENDLKEGNRAKIFGFSFLFSLIMAFNLAMFLAGPETDFTWGLTAGFLAGIWGLSAIAIVGLFELRSWKYIFINGGYIFLALGIMGGILGAWR